MSELLPTYADALRDQKIAETRLQARLIESQDAYLKWMNETRKKERRMMYEEKEERKKIKSIRQERNARSANQFSRWIREKNFEESQRAKWTRPDPQKEKEIQEIKIARQNQCLEEYENWRCNVDYDRQQQYDEQKRLKQRKINKIMFQKRMMLKRGVVSYETWLETKNYQKIRQRQTFQSMVELQKLTKSNYREQRTEQAKSEFKQWMKKKEQQVKDGQKAKQKQVNAHTQEFREFKQEFNQRNCLSAGFMSNFDGSVYPRSQLFSRGRMMSLDGGGQIQANIQIGGGIDALSINSGSVKNLKTKKKKFSVGKSGDKASKTLKGKKKNNEGPDDDEQIRTQIEIQWAKIDSRGVGFVQFFDCMAFSKDLLSSMGNIQQFNNDRFEMVFMKLASDGQITGIIKKENIFSFVKKLLCRHSDDCQECGRQ